MSLISPETLLSALTVNDLKAIIREIIREEMQKEYYVNQDGIRIFYQVRPRKRDSKQLADSRNGTVKRSELPEQLAPMESRKPDSLAHARG